LVAEEGQAPMPRVLIDGESDFSTLPSIPGVANIHRGI